MDWIAVTASRGFVDKQKAWRTQHLSETGTLHIVGATALWAALSLTAFSEYKGRKTNKKTYILYH